ncbi:MAG: RNase adapter RapZ, partial [Kiloniellales bacterium]
KAFEDLGYEAVDNLPLSLLRSLVVPDTGDGEPLERPLAIGVDIRTRGFGVDTLLREIDRLKGRPDLEVLLLYLDCDDEILRRRYSVTRRRHPLVADRPIPDGIRHERELLQPLRQRADVVIDTSGHTLADLKRRLAGQFAVDMSAEMAISVISFSYGRGLPREADLVFDVRFLDNPHYQPALRPLSGSDPLVASFISSDRDFAAFIETLTRLLEPLMPRYEAEGKSYLTIAVGCTGGRHRSVFVAETLANWLTEQGRRVSLHHRDLGDEAG